MSSCAASTASRPIVPNETLVTTTVLNHSYTSKNARVALPVQISYDSDVDLALKIMTDAATHKSAC